jgi:hypothetical protein
MNGSSLFLIKFKWIKKNTPLYIVAVIDFLYEYLVPEKANLAHSDGKENNKLVAQNTL